MKVLLINPPDQLDEILGVGKEFVQKYEPLGLLYLAAIAKKASCHVKVIDAYAENLDINKMKLAISEFEPDIIGITTLTSNGAIVYDLGKWIKSITGNSLVVLGNIHASVYANQYLQNNCCDIVVHGYGEIPFKNIIDYFNKKCAIDEIPGISFVRDGKVVQNPDVKFTKDISDIPFPARDLIDQNLYKLGEISNQIFIPEKGKTAKTMITSRGCPNKCIFCAVNQSSGISFNNPERVVDEMEILEKKYNASYVYIMDSLFMANHTRVEEILKEKQKRKIKLKWGCDTHVNYLTPEIIEMSEKAGCHDLSIGFESGNQKSLDIIKKNFTLEDAKKAVKTIKQHSKIKIEGLFILGLPGEAYEDGVRTINFAKSLPIDMAQFSTLVPYPGSPLYYKLSSEGKIDTGIKKDGIIDTSIWKRYSSYVCFTNMQPIWVNDRLEFSELISLQKRAQREFYLRPKIVFSQLKRIKPQNLVPMIRIAIKGFY
ncbi:B12-binding domain-containing radical SAM protein [Elusimicrobiota bacterium]